MARKKEEKAVRAAYKNERKAKNSQTANDDSFVSLNNQLTVLGLALREIPGDGNCLFRALGDQLEGHTRNHLQHRENVIGYMKQNQTDFEPFIEDNVPFDTYINNLAKPGTFAGNDAIVAFARLHKINVMIHQLNKALWQINGTDSKGAAELHIAYHNGEHYNSIRKLGDSSQNPANLKLGGEINNAKLAQEEKKKVKNDNKIYHSAYCEDIYDDLVQTVMEETGCSDESEIRRCLEENSFDLDATVHYMLCISQIEGDEDSSLECCLGTINEESENDPDLTGVDRGVSPARGARPKMTVLEKLEQRELQKQHLSNRQRKDLKKKERKFNANESKRMSNVGDVSDDDTTGWSENTFIVKGMDCLRI